jgi:pilus assembly protein FimV
MYIKRIAAYLLTLGVSIYALPALALSLGEAQVRSYLGQPLLVEIALPGASQANIAATRIRMGSEADFERLSLSYDFRVANLEVQTLNRGERWVVQIRSRDAFNQPVLEFPLSLRGDQGRRIIKAYTLLLDPPNYTVVTPAVVASRRPATAPAPGPAPGAYRVRRGDTLWPIAQRLKPTGLTTQQMMMALLRENPHAFIDGNINRLRADVVLRVPANDTLLASDPGQASAEVDEQMDEWRAASAAQTPQPQPQSAQPEPQQAPQPKSEPEPEPAEDRLRVLGREALEASEADETLQQQVLLTHEEMEKTRLEQQQLREQIGTLRDEIEHMERLLTLKDEQIATLQSMVAAHSTDGGTQQEAVPAPAASAPVAEPAGETTEAAATAEDIAAVQEAESPAAETERAAEQAVEEETSRESVVTAPASPAEEAPVPATPAQTVQQFLVQWWWLVLGLVVVLLGITLLRRRAKDDPEHEMPLAELPTVLNAPPPPYYDKVRHAGHPKAEQGQSKASASAAKQSAQATMDLSDDSSLLDESLSELSTFPEEEDSRLSGESQFVIDSGSLPGEPINLPPNEKKIIEADEEPRIEDDMVESLEVPMSEEELAELARALHTDADQELAEELQLPSGGATGGDDDSIDRFWSTLDDQPVEKSPAAAASSSDDDDDDDIILDMARAYVELGDREAALDMLEQLMEKTHDPEKQAYIQELIDKVR